jgi:DNA polymerase-3 subunit delta
MASASLPKTPCILVCGEDEFGVTQRAREIYKAWTEEIGGMDHEIIDASASNSGEAIKALSRLREALQTLPFFGGGKVIWLRGCNFLGEERTASAQIVTESLAALGAELKTFVWGPVRLILSAGKVDRRKTFYKTLEKVGSVELFAGWSAEDRDWSNRAETSAARQLRELNKEISQEALSKLVANVGPNPRLLSSETEKLALYVGARREITMADVDVIVTRNKQARAFALGDALGDRNLPRLLRCLDEELWEMRRDPSRSEIGLLYGLITKVRVLLFLKEMIGRNLLKAEGDFSRFKAQLSRIPAGTLPEDKKFNPLSMHPFVLFNALSQTRNFTLDELVQAMDLLLECNQKLISRGLDASLVLQETLVRIVARAPHELQPPGSAVTPARPARA